MIVSLLGWDAPQIATVKTALIKMEMKSANLPWMLSLREILMLLSQRSKKKVSMQKVAIVRRVDASRSTVNAIRVVFPVLPFVSVKVAKIAMII